MATIRTFENTFISSMCLQLNLIQINSISTFFLTTVFQAIGMTAKNVMYLVKVVEPDGKPIQSTKLKPIQSISTYNNFAFEKDGVRAWRAYNIGDGNKYIES